MTVHVGEGRGYNFAYPLNCIYLSGSLEEGKLEVELSVDTKVNCRSLKVTHGGGRFYELLKMV